MSLYLAVFAGDDVEISGWVFGHYSDFGAFRDPVTAHLDASQYPVLMDHSDCDGEWPVSMIPTLRGELSAIAIAFRQLPPEQPIGAFEHTAKYRENARSLYDCFHNVDGQNIFEALDELCATALVANRSVLFQ